MKVYTVSIAVVETDTYDDDLYEEWEPIKLCEFDTPSEAEEYANKIADNN